MTELTGWVPFRRTGLVRAVRLPVATTWVTSRGELMHADPGDWSVMDGSGAARTVDDALFAACHTQVAGVLYRRVGMVEARRAVPGEAVESLEGPTVACAGDWIVRDSAGHRWLVPDGHFRRTYRAVATRGAAAVA